MRHALAILEISLKTLRTNEPIHRREGNIDQADEDFQNITDLEKAKSVLSRMVSSDQMSFGDAVEAAKLGHAVARKGWNGSGMFTYIVPENAYLAQTSVAKEFFGEGVLVPYREYWALKTAQGDVSIWAPSSSDSLADDWYIVALNERLI